MPDYLFLSQNNPMQKFNVGDKVRFLNEKGGGKVKKLIDSRTVMIEIEDGFDIPVLMSELVTEPVSTVSRDIKEQKINQLQVEIREREQREAIEDDEARKSKLRRFAKNPEAEGIYLAFVPHEQQWILTGLIDVILVNHTGSELLYTLSLRNEVGFDNVDYGQMAPYTKVLIETISRNDLNTWCTGFVQAILVYEKSEHMFTPVFSPFDLKANRFYKEGSYVMSGVLGDKAIMVCLQPLVALKTDVLIANNQLATDIIVEPVSAIIKPKALIDKHRKEQGEAIVDLHIGELVDNISGLTSHDMFKIQYDYFEKSLHSAIENEYTKVTYIHGVGNGVLKNAIVKALESFEGVQNRMASMSKFGVGAIDVIIR